MYVGLQYVCIYYTYVSKHALLTKHFLSNKSTHIQSGELKSNFITSSCTLSSFVSVLVSVPVSVSPPHSTLNFYSLFFLLTPLFLYSQFFL